MSSDVTYFQDCSGILCEQDIALTVDIHVGKGFVNPCNGGLVNKLKNERLKRDDPICSERFPRQNAEVIDVEGQNSCC